MFFFRKTHVSPARFSMRAVEGRQRTRYDRFETEAEGQKNMHIHIPTYSRRLHRIEQRKHRKHSVAAHSLFTQKAPTLVIHQVIRLDN